MSEKYYLWICTYLCWTITVNRESYVQARKLLRPWLSGEQSARSKQSHAETCSLLYTTALGITMGMTGGRPNNIWQLLLIGEVIFFQIFGINLVDVYSESVRNKWVLAVQHFCSCLLNCISSLCSSLSISFQEVSKGANLQVPHPWRRRANVTPKTNCYCSTPTFAVLGLHDNLSSPLSFPSLTKQLLPKSLLGQNSTLLLKRVLSFQSASSFTSIFQSKVVEEHKSIVRLADGSWSYYGNSSNPSFYHLSLYYWPIKWYLLTQELEGPAAKLPLSN